MIETRTSSTASAKVSIIVPNSSRLTVDRKWDQAQEGFHVAEFTMSAYGSNEDEARRKLEALLALVREAFT